MDTTSISYDTKRGKRWISLFLSLSCLAFFILTSFAAVSGRCEVGSKRPLSKGKEVEAGTCDTRYGKVLYRIVTVEKGDYLWKIFERTGILGRKDSVTLVKLFSELNRSRENWNYIKPGQRLIIPLRIISKGHVSQETHKHVVPVHETNDLDTKGTLLFDTKPFPFNLPDRSVLSPSPVNIYMKGEVRRENKGRSHEKQVKSGKDTCKLEKEKKCPGTVSKEKHERLINRHEKGLSSKDRESMSIVPHPRIDTRLGKGYAEFLLQMPYDLTDPHTLTLFIPKEESVYKGTFLTLPVIEATVGETVRPISHGKKDLAAKLSEILTSMGGEWINTGEHFIPLKSGGQLTLNAATYPIVNFDTGKMVIVDLNNSLPEDLVRVIMANWDFYRVVHLTPHDDIRSALDRILVKCGFLRVLEKGEAYEFEREGIHYTLKGDWIVIDSLPSNRKLTRIMALNVTSDNRLRIPYGLKRYLDELNIRIVCYPPSTLSESAKREKRPWKWDGNPFVLVEKILETEGKRFERNVSVPVYRNQKTDFNMTVVADFTLSIDGRDAIIDLKSMRPETVSLLRKNKYLVLSLAGEKKPMRMVTCLLDFLHRSYNPGPISFKAVESDITNSLIITIPGVTFFDKDAHMVIATPIRIPGGIAGFLENRGYDILELSEALKAKDSNKSKKDSSIPHEDKAGDAKTASHKPGI